MQEKNILEVSPEKNGQSGHGSKERHRDGWENIQHSRVVKVAAGWGTHGRHVFYGEKKQRLEVPSQHLVAATLATTQ